jgi:hypothetical protein
MTWAVDGPTLVFERTSGQSEGVFSCSSCGKPIEASNFLTAFTTFYSHCCAKRPFTKAKARGATKA